MRTFIFTLILSISFLSHSDSLKASGTFIAKKDCALYQSKAKQINPDNLISKIGDEYRIKQVIRNNDQVEWVRVRTNNSDIPLRWIDASCGSLENFKISNKSKQNNANCNVAKQEDAYVLSISWSPGFCQTHHSKTECQNLSNTYASSHFTLHGLWPNKSICGTKYGFCGDVKNKPRDFCDYPPVPNLSETMRNKLEQYIPSVKHGTCLERHEWWKHGTCSGYDVDDYYNTATSMLEKVNQSDFVLNYIRTNIGKSLSTEELYKEFDNSFGDNARNHISLMCKNGALEEIQIQLPQKLDSEFKTLIHESDTKVKNTCGDKFILQSAQ